ncbi:xylulokinase [Halomonas ramblicola]|uniref:xylulokinase n=1 Tax=Halomonas ramblicola TaxID=747349 RepID=UPI0025B58305|nr:FGGY family carbohydrate kinase [Halomonas ramblicola]MDN3523584.1 FGGY family carbohydrate kinase [Halomonas ramblicola]
MSKVLLGIDAGTSAVKVCAFTPEGRLRAKAQRAVSLVTNQPRWVELDLERYWQLVIEAVKEVANQVAEVSGIGFATTCPTLVLLDKALNPVRLGVSYLDNRACDTLQGLAERLGGEDAAFGATGNRMSSSTFSAATLNWVMEHEPETWARVHHVGFLNSFLAARLTGELATDPTQASYSGLFCAREPGTNWDAELMDAAGIRAEKMVPIRPPEEAVGGVSPATARLTELRAGTPVATGAADTAAAAFALGINQSRTAFESAGTSGVVTFCLDEPEFDKAFLNRRHIIPGLWLAHGAMSTVGGAFGWILKEVWPELHSLDKLEELAAESPPGSNGVVFLPYLAGERSPLWDPNASGAWIGLCLGSRRADMIRAVFEGTAYGLLQNVRRAEQQWNWRPHRMLSVGGGARSRFWLQIKADILGIEFSQSHTKDAAALGAALLGGVAGGVFNGVEDPRLPTAHSECGAILPSRDERCLETYRRMATIYDGLYPALADSMGSLAGFK